MAFRRRYSRRFGIELALAAFAFGGLAVLVSGFTSLVPASKATATKTGAAGHGLWGSGHSGRQNSRSPTIETFILELEKLLPKHGFRLLDARSERIVDGEAVTCDLGNGRFLTTTLVKWLDENGKVELRCELFQDKVVEFSTLVKTPTSQLFFCQRALDDGTQLLIGVGAR